MKKIILIFLTLLMCIACRKAEEIKESVTSPSVVNKTAVSIELLFQGWQILTDSTLESQLWQFEIKKTYSDGSTEIIQPTEDMFSGWDSSSVKDITLIVNIDGLTDSEVISISDGS